MRIAKLSLLSALALSAATFGAKAQFINATLSGTPTSLNLNSYLAFAYYGNNAAGTGTADAGTVSTDLHNIATFTGIELAGTTGTVVSSGPHDSVPVTYIDGQGTQSSATADQLQSFVSGGVTGSGGSGSGVKITSTLFAPVETFQFYLASSNSAADFTLSLVNSSDVAVGTTFHLNDQPLPTNNSSTNNGTSDGSGSKDGLLTITVDGAVGDVLTFSATLDTTGVVTKTNANLGIIAADVSEAPEPGIWSMLLCGGVVLLAAIGLRRFTGLETPLPSRRG
jgi:hypothetical protein